MSKAELTERAIKDAFVELLNEKALARITVKDITDRCGVNRNTFYYHYQDVLDLAEQICEDECDRVVNMYPQINSIEECIEALTKYARENKRAIMHIYRSDKQGSYEASLWRMCEYVVSRYADSAFGDAPVKDEDKALFIRFYKCACFGMVIDWISHDMKDEYVQGLLRVCELKKGTARLILDNCKKDDIILRVTETQERR